MRKRPKTGIAVVGAVVLLVGLGAAGAIAATNALSPSEESQAVIDDAASQLGVEPDELSSALKQAYKNRIDEALEAGRLTEAQASELKERIDSSEYPLIGLGGPRGGHGFGHGPGHFGHGEGLAAAASYLGVTEAELREQLADMTLAEIAKAKGKAVSGLVQAMVDAAEKRIDQAVVDGKLTKEQAAALKEGLADRIESHVNGEFPQFGAGHHGGFGDGSMSHFGGPPA